jgi:tRNA pseudouridine38-40 synthase
VYEYHINLGKENIFYNNYICNYVSNINLKLMKKIAYLFVGTHDFKSFSRSVSDNTIRTIKKITFIKKEQKIIISIMGNGFLRNMVRMIIGNIFDVLENKKTIQQINDLLEHPIKGSAVSKAPACGLYLKKVIY